MFTYLSFRRFDFLNEKSEPPLSSRGDLIARTALRHSPAL